MNLTAAGESLQRHVITVFCELERMHSEMSGFANGLRGSIRLHANSSSLNGFLAADLSSFLSANRQCNIELEEHSSDEIVMAVGDGTADLGIVASDVESGTLQVFPYATDHLVLAVSHEHALARQSRIKLEEALDYDFVCMQRASSNFQFLAQTCGRMGKQLNIRIHAHNFATVLRLARDNIGVALVPRRVLENNLSEESCAVVELSDEWAVRRLKVVTNEIEKAPQFTKNLLDHLLLRVNSSAG
ncbi:MAG: LysR family transcriptional regulator [Tardiphaga sp.]|nr:LysR family transcriptional regulator [Tardiphaga sp.]